MLPRCASADKLVDGVVNCGESPRLEAALADSVPTAPPLTTAYARAHQTFDRRRIMQSCTARGVLFAGGGRASKCVHFLNCARRKLRVLV